ncbi:YeeE/YedE family protein [Marivivens niveibacter]|uniref:YeeE/YedE family protein n=1 Tax=Marivivens niveibacter TaxID=1930667 RepID=A0A251WWJ2_9RHOB|nr:YeeE/YedE family protein [Marivivens niveibacter]OUD08333.1 YeeE/YedE family protein [Marivivens niveibacter]
MLLEYINSDVNVQVLFGLLVGLLFGAAAQVSRFCLRRAVAGEDGADRSALAVWILALAVAMGGSQIGIATGWIELGDHRFLASDVAVSAIIFGGLIFGAGMVLTRGCITRLTVLSATGNLRAATVLVVVAIVAHAMMKGVLAPVRVGLSTVTTSLPNGSFAELPFLSIIIPAILIATALMIAKKSKASIVHLSLGAVIGLVVVAAWVGTSTLLMDEFDPTPVQSVSFTQPWADSLFWVIASSAIPAGFGVGLIGGVLVGAFVSAAIRSELSVVGFSDGAETLRYLAGGALMGAGGVLAGGCTIGAGLTGGSTLSLSALLALGSIVSGAMMTRRLMQIRGASAVA